MAIATREGDFPSQPTRRNIIASFRAQMEPVEDSEASSQRARSSILSRFRMTRRGALKNAALFVLGVVLPVGAVKHAMPSRPDETSWANGVGRQAPESRQSPSLQATLQAQKEANEVKRAEEARVRNDKVQAFQEGLTNTAMVGPDGATPLPATPTPKSKPTSVELISTAMDGAEAGFNKDSAIDPLPTMQPTPNPTPALRVDAGQNFGGEAGPKD